MKSRAYQKGFMVLLIVTVTALIASLWLSAKHNELISVFKDREFERRLDELNKVKQRLLQFAVLHPEIYQTDTSGVIQDHAQIPSPGYFPCPDLDGDGRLTGSETHCGNPFVSGDAQSGWVPDPNLSVGLGACNGSAVCIGFVPEAISSRHFYFAPAGRYYYFLDERFSILNFHYVNGAQQRYAPLNPSRFDPNDSETNNDPVLNLDGVGGYIALIIDAGADGLDAVNRDGNRYFLSNPKGLIEPDDSDRAVGITYDEWLTYIAHRICMERRRFEGLDSGFSDIGASLTHWYNDYDAVNNPLGGSWRHWGELCM